MFVSSLDESDAIFVCCHCLLAQESWVIAVIDVETTIREFVVTIDAVANASDAADVVAAAANAFVAPNHPSVDKKGCCH